MHAGGYDPPFFAALVDAMNGRPHRSGLLPLIGGAAGPMLSSLNPNKIICRGWSGSAHMVSWLIQAVATKQLTGIGIAAGLMFSGGAGTSFLLGKAFSYQNARIFAKTGSGGQTFGFLTKSCFRRFDGLLQRAALLRRIVQGLQH